MQLHIAQLTGECIYCAGTAALPPGPDFSGLPPPEIDPAAAGPSSCPDPGAAGLFLLSTAMPAQLDAPLQAACELVPAHLIPAPGAHRGFMKAIAKSPTTIANNAYVQVRCSVIPGVLCACAFVHVLVDVYSGCSLWSLHRSLPVACRAAGMCTGRTVRCMLRHTCAVWAPLSNAPCIL